MKTPFSNQAFVEYLVLLVLVAIIVTALLLILKDEIGQLAKTLEGILGAFGSIGS